MTVPHYQQDETDLVALLKAVELEAMTALLCKKLPRSWSFVRTRYITGNANGIIECVARGNNIRVTTVGDYVLRRAHFMEARALCDVLQKKIDYLEKEKPEKGRPKRDENGKYVLDKEGKKVWEYVRCLTDNQTVEWSRLAGEVERLVKGLIEFDRKKHPDFHAVAKMKEKEYCHLCSVWASSLAEQGMASERPRIGGSAQ